MYLSILLLLISETRGQDYDTKEKTDLVIFGNDTCNRKVLFRGYGRAYHLAMHASTRELYFSRAVRTDDFNDREIIACRLQDKKCRNVQGIISGSTVAYAHSTDELYFGGKNGIYKYDFGTKRAKLKTAKGLHIWDIFSIENYFYYIVYPSKTIFAVVDLNFENATSPIDGEVDVYFVTKDYALFFSNSTGLFKVEKPAVPQKKPFMIGNDIHVRQITQDFYNNIYFGAYEGIYTNVGRRIKKISRINSIFGITYVNLLASSGADERMVNVIIYSNERHIYRLICNYDNKFMGVNFGDF